MASSSRIDQKMKALEQRMDAGYQRLEHKMDAGFKRLGNWLRSIETTQTAITANSATKSRTTKTES
jgi:hypothetical protein